MAEIAADPEGDGIAQALATMPEEIAEYKPDGRAGIVGGVAYSVTSSVSVSAFFRAGIALRQEDKLATAIRANEAQARWWMR